MRSAGFIPGSGPPGLLIPRGRRRSSGLSPSRCSTRPLSAPSGPGRRPHASPEVGDTQDAEPSAAHPTSPSETAPNPTTASALNQKTQTRNHPRSSRHPKRSWGSKRAAVRIPWIGPKGVEFRSRDEFRGVSAADTRGEGREFHHTLPCSVRNIPQSISGCFPENSRVFQEIP